MNNRYARPNGLIEKQVTIEGKRKVFRAKSERELNRKMANYKGESVKGRLFSDIAYEWKEEYFPKIAHGTQMCYNPALKRAVEWLNEMLIKEVEACDIDALILDMAGKGYSAQTIKTQKALMGMIFDYAIIKKDIKLNPVRSVKVPRNLPKQKRKRPQDDNVQRILKSADKHFGLFAFMILITGCRRGEALALQINDLDFENEIIKINKSVYFYNNQPLIKTPKTESGNREIIMPDILASELKKIKGSKNTFIFGLKDTPMTEKAFNYHWKKYLKDADLDHITPHQLRHGYSTILYEAAVDDFEAKDQLGHSDIQITKNIYTELRKNKKEEARKKINDYLGNMIS